MARNAAYTIDTIKGAVYALFTVTAASADVVASYAVDSDAAGDLGASVTGVTDTAATVHWTTDEPADSQVEYGIAADQLNQSQTSAGFALSHSIQLTGLSPTTTYFYKVTSADASGNTASSGVRSFTTPKASWQETSEADFADGSNAGTGVTATGGGAVELATSGFGDDFAGPDGPAGGWTAWPASGDLSVTPTWHVANGVLRHDLNESASTYHPIVPSVVTPSGDVTITARERIVQSSGGGGGLPVLGFVAGGADNQHYYIVQWYGGAIKIYHRPDFSLIGQASIGDPGVGQWYDMKLEITGTTMKVYVDGTLRLTADAPGYAGGKIGLLAYQGSLNEYDDVTISGEAYLASGTYTSSVFDAGASALWGKASWTADTPAGTTLDVSVRTGNTPTPGATWSAFAPLSNGGNVGTSGRYAQYRAQLSSSAGTATPRLRDITLVVDGYVVDSTAPVISAIGEQNVTDTTATVEWTTDEPADGKVDYGLAAGQLDQSKTSAVLALSHSLQLTGLSPATTYFYKVTSADASGNPSSSAVRSFTTPSASVSWQETSEADFADGTNAGTAVTATGGGAVELATVGFSDGFSDGPAPIWTAWPAFGNLNVTPAWHVANGVLVHELNDSVPSYHPMVPQVTPSGDVTITSRQRVVQAGLPLIGFVAGGTDPQNYYWVQWAGQGLGMRAYRLQGGGFTQIASAPGDPAVGQWYDMKLEITGTTMKVSVDGAERLTATLPAYTGGKVGLLGYGGSLNEYDDVTISGNGYMSSGTYTSSVFDAGASALWGKASWTADTPAGTTLDVSVRTGNTPTPGATWSAFAPLSNGGNVGTSGRYAQYRAQLSSSAGTATPRLRDITLVVDGYVVDSTAPVISAIGEQNVTDTTATVEWTTDEPADGKVDYGLAAGQLDQSKTSAVLALSHSLQLTGLSPATTYFYKVTSADASGNPSSSAVRSFTTPSASVSWQETSEADFADGTNAGTAVTATGGGAVELATAGFTEDFSEPDGPPANWTAWPASGNLNVTPAWHVANGVLVHDVNANATTYHPIVPNAITPTGDVTITSRQRIVQLGGGVDPLPLLGFVAGGTDTENYYIVQWFGSNLRVYRRQTGGGFTPIASGSVPGPVVGQWYDMKLEITGTTMKVYVDGAEGVSATLPAYTGGKVGLLGYEGSLNEYDDVTISGSYLPSGTYTSSVFDAGASALWGLATWTADTPAGTNLGVSVRTGNTPTPDGTWSAFALLTNGGTIGTSGRYAQYQAQLSSSTATATPRLDDITLRQG